MNWTTESPTEPGLYLYISAHGQSLRILSYGYRGKSTQVVPLGSDTNHRALALGGGRWSRITLPTDLKPRAPRAPSKE